MSYGQEACDKAEEAQSMIEALELERECMGCTIAELTARAEKYETALKHLREFMKSMSCGDNSCIFWKPRGMATNGGCRTLADHESRIAVQHLAREVRKALEALDPEV